MSPRNSTSQSKKLLKLNLLESVVSKLFQQIWDFVYVVESSVDDWKKTAWKQLDVEEMEQVCKKFTKDVRSLGKTVRHWQPFLHVEQLLKNLQTSLRAITELQNTAIRDRHWNELMQSTGVSFRSLISFVDKQCEYNSEAHLEIWEGVFGKLFRLYLLTHSSLSIEETAL